VLSELSFHTNPLFSFRMHIDSEISLFACSGYKWIFLRNKSLIYSFHVWIIKFTKKTLSLVSATSDSFMPLSAHGVINSICFTCSGYMCYRNCPFHCSHLIFLLGCIFIQKYLFTCSENKFNIILRNKILFFNSSIVQDSEIYEKNSFACFWYKWCVNISFGSIIWL